MIDPVYKQKKTTKNGSRILGIKLKCRDHGWQRTIHIKDGMGCNKCYGDIPIKKLLGEENEQPRH